MRSRRFSIGSTSQQSKTVWPGGLDLRKVDTGGYFSLDGIRNGSVGFELPAEEGGSPVIYCRYQPMSFPIMALCIPLVATSQISPFENLWDDSATRILQWRSYSDKCKEWMHVLFWASLDTNRWLRFRYILTLTATGVLLRLGLNNVYLTSRSIPHLWSLAFGNVNAENLITINHTENLSGPTSVIATVLVANLPQILLSFLYFAYNGMFTCMLLVEE